MTDQRQRTRRASTRGASVVASLAIAVAVATGCGPSSVAPSAPVDAERTTAATPSELPLVTVPPTAAAPLSPAAPPTAGPAAAGEGIRADRIRIERLGIDLRIIEGDGIDAPIGRAAHYPGTAWPGGGSNIYIYGHARDGMFITLWDVRKGDEIVLDLVDGTSRTYVVTRILPRVAWDAVEYLEPTRTEQLTLQTSTSYQATAPRFIVIAAPKA